MYRTLFYVNIYGSYKLLKTVRFFLAHPVEYRRRDVSAASSALGAEREGRMGALEKTSKELKLKLHLFDLLCIVVGLLWVCCRVVVQQIHPQQFTTNRNKWSLTLTRNTKIRLLSLMSSFFHVSIYVSDPRIRQKCYVFFLTHNTITDVVDLVSSSITFIAYLILPAILYCIIIAQS